MLNASVNESAIAKIFFFIICSSWFLTIWKLLSLISSKSKRWNILTNSVIIAQDEENSNAFRSLFQVRPYSNVHLLDIIRLPGMYDNSCYFWTYIYFKRDSYIAKRLSSLHSHEDCRGRQKLGCGCPPSAARSQKARAGISGYYEGKGQSLGLPFIYVHNQRQRKTW